MMENGPSWARILPAIADNDRNLDWVKERSIEYAPAEEIRLISSSTWESQRAYVAENSQFYQNKYAGIVDLKRLPLKHLPEAPFTTKAELQMAQSEEPPFGAHLAATPNTIKRIYKTSGSSGIPLMIAITQKDSATWRTIGTRSYYATGLRSHNSVLTTLGAGPFVVGHTHRVLEELQTRTIPVGPGDTASVIDAFETGLVDTMLSTPSFALYLADRFAKEGVEGQRYGLLHLIVGGEPGGGLPVIRARIESAFGATVTEVMGIGEIAPSLFGECPAQQGMHFCGQGFVWPELIDTNGMPVPIEPGAEGEIVYTHLEREAMPVIRFRSGDHATILSTDCPCSRTSFTVRISGRVDDMFIVSGVNVYPSAIQSVVGTFTPEVTGRTRVVLPPDSVSVAPPVPIEIEISPGTSTSGPLASRIADAIHARLKFRASVVLVGQKAFGTAEYKTALITRKVMRSESD